MNIELSPEVEQLLRKKIGEGTYSSANDVLHQALSLLEEHDQFLETHRDEIRAKIDEARKSLDRGEGVDGEQVFERLFRELDEAERRKRA